MTREVPTRSEFLTPRHGAENVLLVLATHAALVLWFQQGHALLPPALYVLLSVPAAVIHVRAMSEWIHEGGHRNLIPSSRWNDRLTDALVAFWFGTTTEAYRSTHFPHHARRSFFSGGDPDTHFLEIETRSDLRRALLRDVTGVTMVRQFLRFERGTPRGERRLAPLAWTAAAHLLLVGGLLWIGRLDAYLLYYASLVLGYPLHNRFRVYGQHVTLEPDGASRFAGSQASRTIDAGLLDRVLWTSPRLLYHYEHHRFPHLPWRALEGLCERGDDVNRYAESRLDVMKRVLRGLPRGASAGDSQ